MEEILLAGKSVGRTTPTKCEYHGPQGQNPNWKITSGFGHNLKWPTIFREPNSSPTSASKSVENLTFLWHTAGR